MFKYILNRLTERSTWLGMSLIHILTEVVVGEALAGRGVRVADARQPVSYTHL